MRLGQRSVRCALGVLALLATLPLLWQSLAETPLGTVRIFHFGALALFALGRPEDAAWRAVLRALRPLGPGLLFFTVAMTACAAAYGSYWANPVQNAVYAGVGVFAGACFLTALREDVGRRLLVWAAPLTLAVFVVVFGRSMQAAGVDPVAAYRRALLGDRGVILHDVFRRVFSASGGGDDDVLSQTRHEIYGSLLVAACVSLLAHGRSLAMRVLIVASQFVILMLILTSLSRAVIIATTLVLVLVLVRVYLRAYIPVSVALATLVTLAVSPWIAEPLTRIVVDRFIYDTASYEGRAGSWRAFGEPDVVSRLALGGGALPMSTHTMVGDALLTGGLVAALGAVAEGVALIRVWWLWAVRWVHLNDTAALAAAGIIGMATVRAFTSGGGLLHMAMWNAIGLAGAFVALIREREPKAVALGKMMHRSHGLRYGELRKS